MYVSYKPDLQIIISLQMGNIVLVPEFLFHPGLLFFERADHADSTLEILLVQLFQFIHDHFDLIKVHV